jgi:hypothetical protein
MRITVDLGGGPVSLKVAQSPTVGRNGLWLDRCPRWTHTLPCPAAFVDVTQADDLVGAAVAIAYTDGVKAIGLAPVTAAGSGSAVALTVGW